MNAEVLLLQNGMKELYEACYTLIRDEAKNEGVELGPKEIAEMAREMAFNLSVQDALLSEANAIVKRSQIGEVSA